jgi:hypothetical protein
VAGKKGGQRRLWFGSSFASCLWRRGAKAERRVVPLPSLETGDVRGAQVLSPLLELAAMKEARKVGCDVPAASGPFLKELLSDGLSVPEAVSRRTSIL